MQALNQPMSAAAGEAARVAKRALSREAFVWLAGSLCAQHGVPFDARLLLQQSAPPYDDASLEASLRRLGIDCVAVTAAGVDAPAIAWLAAQGAGESAGDAADHAPSAYLVARYTATDVLLFPVLQ